MGNIEDLESLLTTQWLQTIYMYILVVDVHAFGAPHCS